MRRLRNTGIVLAMLATQCVPVRAQPLRVAVEGDGAYAPFSMFKDGKTLTGFDIEIAKALCAHVPDGCDIVPDSFEVMVDNLADGKYDVTIASMGYTAERDQKILYGPIYYRSHTIFMGNPDKYADISPAALKGVRLASAQGTIQQKYLRDTYAESTIIEAKNMNDAFDKLVQGDVDLVLGDSIVLMSFLQSDKGHDFAYVGQALKAEAFSSKSYITFHKGLEAKSEVFADALKRIRLDGTYDRINRNFVPFSIY